MQYNFTQIEFFFHTLKRDLVKDCFAATEHLVLLKFLIRPVNQ
jgi:hypothetical protein